MLRLPPGSGTCKTIPNDSVAAAFVHAFGRGIAREMYRHLRIRCFNPPQHRTSIELGERPKIMKPTLVAAIHSKQKLRVTFYSKQDGAPVERTCAPMDLGPSRRAKDQSDRFHLWDYDSDNGPHPLSLPVDQVITIAPLTAYFEPSEFVTWSTISSPWTVARNWGAQS